MKIVTVSYTTTAEYAAKNQSNIQNVMADLRKLNHPGIRYNACLGQDGKTFTHTAFYYDEDDQIILTELPSFKQFQEQLKASGPEVSPKQELLTLVGSAKNIF